MASPHLYVRSTDGSDADNGTTWALAKATIAGAAAIDSTTDNRIWVSDNHAESSAAAQTWAFAGTFTTPTWLVCVDDTSNPEPPTATATTATVTTTGASNVSISGHVFVQGLTINCGSGASLASIYLSPNSGEYQEFDNCVLKIITTSGNAQIVVGAATGLNPAVCKWHDVNVQLSASSQCISVTGVYFEWCGGSVLAGTTPTTNGLIRIGSRPPGDVVQISGVDFSALGTSLNLCSSAYAGRVVFRNCKLPASWAGSVVTGSIPSGFRAEMYNCDSTDTNYRLHVEDNLGSIVSDTSVYNDAGVDDGSAQGFSWKMVTNSSAEFPFLTLVSPEIVKWNETTTGTLTATVEIVHNSQGSGTNGALLDSEIWLEVMCMDPGGTPIGKWQSDRCGNLNLNADAADQASSSASWTGDSAGWDTQKLVVSFTPKEKGFVHARVCLAKASATVYVDPLITVT